MAQDKTLLAELEVAAAAMLVAKTNYEDNKGDAELAPLLADICHQAQADYRAIKAKLTEPVVA